MTATPKPGQIPVPPFAIYRSKVAAWEDGTVKLLYTRLKGQGSMVLIEDLPGDDPVELGHKYQLTLVRIKDGEPTPPIEMPTFPALPEPPLELLPPDYQNPDRPIYQKPPGVEHPIYPGEPEYPGIERPIYKPDDKPDAPDRPQPQ